MAVIMQIYPNNPALHNLYKELIAKDKKEREHVELVAEKLKREREQYV